MNDQNFFEYPYLIIGGTTKAATTSLYQYLRDHPEVCVSNIKETRFFLDKDYPLQSKYRFEDGREHYAEFFSHCEEKRLRSEATPDYLYSTGTPGKIKSMLPNAKLVFVLREPSSRIMSWYRFAMQNDMLEANVSIDKYVMQQLEAGDQLPEQHLQHMRAVEQGQYAHYLRPYFETFGHENIFICFLEELAAKPLEVLRALCNFAGIDANYYETYEFKVYNRTETLKHPSLHRVYKQGRFNLVKRINTKPALKAALGRIKRLVEPVYMYFNRAAPEEVAFSPKVQAALKKYYASANQELSDLLGRPLPW